MSHMSGLDGHLTRGGWPVSRYLATSLSTFSSNITSGLGELGIAVGVYEDAFKAKNRILSGRTKCGHHFLVLQYNTTFKNYYLLLTFHTYMQCI